MVYHTKPADFSAKFEIVSCFVEADRDILLLLRQDNKPQGNTLGVPAGKVNPKEDHLSAILREIYKETGFHTFFEEPEFYGTVFVRYPEYDFVYHIYHLDLPMKIQVQINPQEHKGFAWVKPEQALRMRLIGDLDACIRLFYKLQ